MAGGQLGRESGVMLGFAPLKARGRLGTDSETLRSTPFPSQPTWNRPPSLPPS